MNSTQPTRPGEPVLPVWRSISDTRSSLLTEALEEYRQLLEAGHSPDRAAFVARYPEVAGALSDCLAGLELVHAAARLSGEEGDSTTDAPAPPAHPLSDFRLVREVGRGGMGIVYEAEQISLGRRVALKVLPIAAALDPRRLQRFRNEAHAAAQLQHPHIVPVYAIGQEHGVHYYAMQFIDGPTLAEVIRRVQHDAGASANESTQTAEYQADGNARIPLVVGPSTLLDSAVGSPAFYRAVATLGFQAADALEQAHQIGIVHRDIKPANLMLDEHDHLWITDFGLARQVNEGENLTLSGDLLGTIRYMSPEQALARHGLVDQRTDIYALAITLYELVTRRPAFDALEREELVRQVSRDDPRPPRRIDPRIPVDLETIILKAASKEPDSRYATARELGDDLARFLRQEPIRARRTGPSERIVKWCRRRPALVRSAVLLTVALVVVLAAGTLLIWRAKLNADAANSQAQNQAWIARQAEEHAKTEAWLARKVIDDLYRPANYMFIAAPGGDEIQRELFYKAVAFYEQLAQESPGDSSIQLSLAELHSKSAEVLEVEGERLKAKLEWDNMRAILTALPARVQQEPRGQYSWSLYYHAQTKSLREAGNYREAERAVHRAFALLDPLVAKYPTHTQYRYTFAACRNELGLILEERGQPGAARQAFQQALEVLQRLKDENPSLPLAALPLAQAYNNYANLLQASIAPRPGTVGTLPSLVVGAVATDARHPSLGFTVLLVDQLMTRGQTVRETAQAYVAAIKILKGITVRYSGPLARFELALAWHNLGRLFALVGDRKQATLAYQQALFFLKELCQVYPHVAAYRTTLAGAQEHMDELTGRGPGVASQKSAVRSRSP